MLTLRLIFLFFAFHLLGGPATAQSEPPIKMVVTLPEIGEIAKKIGGESVDVVILLTGNEDPHFMDANPSLVSKIARADIVCAMGLDLESGWLPKALEKSGNAKVQSGGAGFCELGTKVSVLETPRGSVDRSMGHIHRAGNPHFNLSPRALGEGGLAVVEVLSRTRPKYELEYKKRYREFVDDMNRVETETKSILKSAIEASASKAIAIEYHKEFAYFFNLYGIKSMGSIEEKPGVPPSAGHLAEVALKARHEKINIALASLTSPRKHMARFSELSGVPFKLVPTLMKAPGAMWGSETGTDASSIEKVQKIIALAIAESVSKRPR